MVQVRIAELWIFRPFSLSLCFFIITNACTVFPNGNIPPSMRRGDIVVNFCLNLIYLFTSKVVLPENRFSFDDC